MYCLPEMLIKSSSGSAELLSPGTIVTVADPDCDGPGDCLLIQPDFATSTPITPFGWFYEFWKDEDPDNCC